MAFRIENPGKLAADRRGVFDRLSERLSMFGADAAYNALPAAKKGKIISVDTARFLAPEFRSWSGRIRHTPSTGNPAGAYAHDRMLRELSRERTGTKRLLITAGGAGSGKTSQLAGLTAVADLVFDNQFKDFVRARTLLRASLQHGWKPEVVYVYRPLQDAVRAVIDRSQRTGRWNLLAELPGAYAAAQTTLLQLSQEFGGQINIHAIYNASQGQGTQASGSRVLLSDFRAGSRYHVTEHEKNCKEITGILDKAISEGIVCLEVARIIAQGLPWQGRRKS